MKALGCALLLLGSLPLQASERTRVVALRVDREGVALVAPPTPPAVLSP